MTESRDIDVCSMLGHVPGCPGRAGGEHEFAPKPTHGQYEHRWNIGEPCECGEPWPSSIGNFFDTQKGRDFIRKPLNSTRCPDCGHRLDSLEGCDSCSADREAAEWEWVDASAE